MNVRGHRYRNLLLFISLAGMWGSSFVGIKAGLDYFPPVLYAALRYEIATIVMFAYALFVADRWRPRGWAEWINVGVSGALIIGAYHALLFAGEQDTTSAVAAILVSMSPVLVPGFARLLLPDERLSWLGLIGLGVGFLGVILVTRPDPTGLLTNDFLGEALIFVAAACFALGSVLTQRVEVSLPVETRQAWAMGIGAVLMHTASVGIGESATTIQWTTEGITTLLYLAFVPSALGFLVYFDLLDRLGSIEINLVSYVNPVFAALIGWIWLGEGISPLTVFGFAVIVTGFVLMKRDTLTAEVATLRTVTPEQMKWW